jgi:membrane-associated phospholipid phosphatase
LLNLLWLMKWRGRASKKFSRRKIVRDIRRMWTRIRRMSRKKSLFIWGGIGILAVLAAFALDGAVDGLLRLDSRGLIYKLAGLLSRTGDWPVLSVIGLCLVVLLYFLRRPEISRLILLVLVAGMLAGFSATVIRSCAGRTRPSSQLPQGFYGPRHDSRWIFGRYEFGAFPSGHTATVAGLTAALWLVRRRWAAAFAVFAVAVGWSRIALNCHHFSDVVAAAVWGIFIGAWLFWLLESTVRTFSVRT